MKKRNNFFWTRLAFVVGFSAQIAAVDHISGTPLLPIHGCMCMLERTRQTLEYPSSVKIIKKKGGLFFHLKTA